MNRNIVILGSTGSIGTQSLAVCRNLGCRVTALAAGTNVKLLEQQAREFLPQRVVIRDERAYQTLKCALSDTNIRVEAGAQAVCDAAAMEGAEIVVNAIVGIAGLRPTLAALEVGKTLALSNKEALITGGQLVLDTAKRGAARILPIDSEHSAIFQCMQAGRTMDVTSVLLTASGGPFVGKTLAELQKVEVRHALAHPNWSMGAKISVDSATLMNKGLEFVEAMWLFGLRPDQIEVVVHRQSVVHSAVEFADGSVIAQMGVPDMRGAIQYALTYPARLPTGVSRLSMSEYGSLTFEQPNLEVFSCLAVMIDAARRGGLAPCVVNGANEAAVALFLAGKIGFLRIGELARAALEAVKPASTLSLADIEATDAAAREFVLSAVQERG